MIMVSSCGDVWVRRYNPTRTILDPESKTTQEEGIPEVDFLQLYCSDERGSDLRTDKELEVGSLVFQQEAYAAVCSVYVF